MIMRKTWCLLLLTLAATSVARAQINCAPSSAAATKMSCLIPATVTPTGYTFSNGSSSGTNLGAFQNGFAFLSADIGGQISQIPLASPASGLILIYDKDTKTSHPHDQPLGPILTQRAETIGEGKLYIAATYQYFLLEDVDGLSLKRIPAVFFLNSPGSLTSGPDTVSVANTRVDLKIHQFVGYITYGVRDWLDVSAAIPVLQIDMRYTVNEQLVPIFGSNPSTSFQNSRAAQSTGIGDIVLAVKASAWKRTKGGGVALGSEFRLPTGDPLNYLGSGTFGMKPYAAFTYGTKYVSPHANIGYEINGNTPLVAESGGGNGPLPSRLIYSGGADVRVFSRLTVSADVLAQRVFAATRAQIVTDLTPLPNSQILISAVNSTIGTYDRLDGSIGLKYKPYKNFLISGNLLVKLDQGGLRQRLAPLVGLSYTFDTGRSK